VCVLTWVLSKDANHECHNTRASVEKLSQHMINPESKFKVEIEQDPDEPVPVQAMQRQSEQKER
jgi:hypothetical protein